MRHIIPKDEIDLLLAIGSPLYYTLAPAIRDFAYPRVIIGNIVSQLNLIHVSYNVSVNVIIEMLDYDEKISVSFKLKDVFNSNIFASRLLEALYDVFINKATTSNEPDTNRLLKVINVVKCPIVF